MPSVHTWIRRIVGGGPPLVVCPVNGIGNRMRALASADAFARQHGLSLSMCWEPGEGFSELPFEALFANAIPRISRDQVDALVAGGVPRLGAWCHWSSEGLRPTQALDRDTALETVCQRGLVFDRAFMNLFSLLARIRVRGVGRDSRAVGRAHRRLRVAAPIAELAARYARDHFAGQRVVGVHVRRGDAVDGPLAHQYIASTDAAFLASMDRELAAKPDTVFFLATDDAPTLARFKERYSGRILCVDKEFVRSDYGVPKEGQAEALLELTLLSKTAWVLGTEGSTFGQAAARMGGRRFRGAIEVAQRTSAR